MSMERHRCKVCSKNFSNGRALGGHMRSHLATLPLPPKKKTEQLQQLGDRTESDSSSTHSDQESDEKLSGYGLRENPKRSLKGNPDPEFLDAGSVVQEDRESETESTQNPTRRRSKRPVQRSQTHENESKKSKKSESVTESSPVSSVSDASHQDEEVALCLMMLSRDNRVWRRETREEKPVQDTNDSAELIKTRVRTRGWGARKICKANRAPGGHKESQQQENKNNDNGEEHRIYECPFCGKVFGSGQALGGHKRSHLLGSSTNNYSKVDDHLSKPNFILDLNLPAPIDDIDHQDLGSHLHFF